MKSEKLTSLRPQDIAILGLLYLLFLTGCEKKPTFTDASEVLGKQCAAGKSIATVRINLEIGDAVGLDGGSIINIDGQPATFSMSMSGDGVLRSIITTDDGTYSVVFTERGVGTIDTEITVNCNDRGKPVDRSNSSAYKKHQQERQLGNTTHERYQRAVQQGFTTSGYLLK